MNAVLPDRWLRLIPMTADRGLRLVRGDGAYVWDEDDRRYLDLDSDHGSSLLGYGQASVVDAVDRQLRRLTAAHHAFDHDARDELVEALSVLAPEPLSHVVIVNTDVEAIEVALIAARTITRRSRVIAMEGASRGHPDDARVHTRRGTPKHHALRRDEDAVRVPYGDLDALEAVLDNRVAAVIVEPIQGDAGVVIPPDGYLAGVAERCLRRGVMLIVDETQTALRTGSLLVSTRQRVLPDILCLSRGIANGMPIGVMVTRTEVARRLRLRPGWHDSTDASNPLICATATATLRIATNPTLQGHVNSVGDYFLARLQALRIAGIRQVRGSGLMIAVELRHAAAPVLRSLEERGVLAIPGNNGVIRFYPPLILERRQVDVAVEALAAAIRGARRAPAGDEVTLRGVATRRVKP
jgi:LysW-gamma-L-lysine/LysW-L-ornithine aminotransferase